MRLPRLHKSSIIIGLVAAVALALIELPGRIVAGFVGGTSPTTVYEHGWPWTYLRRETAEKLSAEDATGPFLVGHGFVASFPIDVRTDLPKWGIPWLGSDNRRFWESDKEAEPPHWDFNGVVGLCDLVVALSVIAVAVAAWEYRRRRRPRILSFRLTDIMITVTAVCAALGWVVYQEREYQREQLLVDRFSIDWMVDDEVCVAPRWLQSLIGTSVFSDFFWRAGSVTIFPDPEDPQRMARDIASLVHLSKIRVCMSLPDAVPFPFSVLRAASQVDTLDIDNDQALNARDVDEVAQLAQLKKLILWGKDDLSPDLLARLEAALPYCEVIDFMNDW